jgi:hypothetical protein
LLGVAGDPPGLEGVFDVSHTPPTTPSPPYDWSLTDPPPLALSGIAYFAPLYEHVTLADRKAAFFLSAGGLMLTVLGFFAGHVEHVVSAGGWRATLLVATLAVVIVLVLTAGVLSYVAYRRPLGPTPPSLVVFREIARRSLEEYERDVLALTHAQAFVGMLRYNHVVATLGAAKFRLVNRALAILRIAIPLWMLVLLTLAIAG